MMTDRLQGKRILVVEDEYFIAADIRIALLDAGAQVVGPAGKLGMALVLAEEPLDAAVLDVNLAGENSFPIVDRLRSAAVPCLLVTGYDDWALPAAYSDVPRLIKPSTASDVVIALAGLVGKD